jgi:hypothetical protein
VVGWDAGEEVVGDPGAVGEHELARQRAAARLDPAGRRIDGPDLSPDELDPGRQKVPQWTRDPLRLATSNEEPE